MAFLQEDDDAFEAALSFVDEFACSTRAEEDIFPPSSSSPSLDDLVPRSNDTQDAADSSVQSSGRSRRRATAKTPGTEDEKKRRRVQLNEKRKLLRKAGVYGDANRARNERAWEIAYLREQMEKLQVELQVLQSRQGGERKEDSAAALTPSSSDSQIMSLWQGLADQQRHRREEADRDNALLKLAFERQKKVANGLVRMMHTRATQLTNECSSLVTLACANHHLINVLDFHGDIGDFEGLFRRLDEAYRMLDTVFMGNGLAGMTIPAIDVHMERCVDGNSLEFASYKVLPFDVHATGEVTWKHFKGVEKHTANGSLYEKAEKGLDEPYTIVADFKKEVYSNSSRADIQVKQVIRRYVEDDRDIVIWVSRAVPIEIKHKVLRGLTYHLRGYAVTKRSSESTPDREVSVLQLCYLLCLDHDTGVRYDPSNLHALTNFLVTTTVQNIRAHRERIENALVDRSLPRRIQQ